MDFLEFSIINIFFVLSVSLLWFLFYHYFLSNFFKRIFAEMEVDFKKKNIPFNSHLSGLALGVVQTFFLMLIIGAGLGYSFNFIAPDSLFLGEKLTIICAIFFDNLRVFFKTADRLSYYEAHPVGLENNMEMHRFFKIAISLILVSLTFFVLCLMTSITELPFINGPMRIAFSIAEWALSFSVIWWLIVAYIAYWIFTNIFLIVTGVRKKMS